MNPQLSVREMDALLDILGCGLARIRLAAAAGNVQEVEAIADALHNVPLLLKDGHERNWTLAHFRDVFLTDLIERHPDLAGLRTHLEHTP